MAQKRTERAQQPHRPVNKQSPLATRKRISLREVKDKEILTYSMESPVAAGITDVVERYGLKAYRGYDEEATLSSLVSRNRNSVAMFCYSFLVNAFEDVVCIPIREVPVDFHKVYLVSRNEAHSQLVSKFIDFMTSYRFPNILDVQE